MADITFSTDGETATWNLSASTLSGDSVSSRRRMVHRANEAAAVVAAAQDQCLIEKAFP